MFQESFNEIAINNSELIIKIGEETLVNYTSFCFNFRRRPLYLGFIKRGITILIFTIVIGYAAPGLIPMYGWIIVIGLWIWQIYDVSNHYEKLNPEEQDTK